MGEIYGDVWSDDQDLLEREPGINCYIPEGQGDFLPQHNAAKREILDLLIKDKVLDAEFSEGDAESQLVRTSELRLLSTFKTLEIIFGFLMVNGGDRFAAKEEKYFSMFNNELENVKRSLSVDKNNDGKITKDEIQTDHGPRLGRI